jgi:flavin-binding protein dodecin
MSDHVYKSVELTGSSKKSVEDAVENAISRASKTIRNMRWFQVVETRGYIEKDEVSYWQVTIKVGFTVEGD